MTDLLTVEDYDSAAFFSRLNGCFAHCSSLYAKVEDLNTKLGKRVLGIKQNIFLGLAEIGEALLRVQESKPREFELWFEMHETQIGFSLRHAESCKGYARLVRDHGETAFEISQTKSNARPLPMFALHVSLSRPLEELTRDERLGLLKKLEPAVEMHSRISALDFVNT